MIHFLDLTCKYCIYARGKRCNHEAPRKNGERNNIYKWVGCGKGEWLYRDLDGTVSVVSWGDYWILYGEEGEFYNEETQARERTGTYYWNDIEILDWREM